MPQLPSANTDSARGGYANSYTNVGRDQSLWTNGRESTSEPQRTEFQGQIGYINDEYLSRYREDAPGSEAAPNARVWRMFMDETSAYDSSTIMELRENTDVLLVFSGLFSAVVTAFVVWSADKMQPDIAAMSLGLLFEIAMVQRASVNATFITDIPFSLFKSPVRQPSLLVAWTNGLWFTSLALSLLAALVAVLARQWLHRFAHLPGGPARDRSRIRQVRYTGFMQWRVPTIIGLLPMALHAALALFLVGLTILLIEVQPLSAVAVGILSGLSFAAYTVATALPLLYDGCPYRTPLTGILFSAQARVKNSFSLDMGSSGRSSGDQATAGGSTTSSLYGFSKDSYVDHFHRVDAAAVKRREDFWDCRALSWLYSKSPNLGVRAIILQSIGGLQSSVDSKLLQSAFSGTTVSHDCQDMIQECLVKPRNKAPGFNVVDGQDSTFRRLLQFEHRFYGSQPGPLNGRQQDLTVIHEPLSPTTLTASLLFSKDHGKRSMNGPHNAPEFIRRVFLSAPHPGNLVLHPFYWEKLVESAVAGGLFSATKSAGWAHDVLHLFRWLGYNKAAFWNDGYINQRSMVSGFDISEGLNLPPVRNILIQGIRQALPMEYLVLPHGPLHLMIVLSVINALTSWLPRETVQLCLMDKQHENPYDQKLPLSVKQNIRLCSYVKCISCLLDFLTYAVGERKVGTNHMKAIFDICEVNLLNTMFTSQSRDVPNIPNPASSQVLNASTYSRGALIQLLTLLKSFPLHEKMWFSILNAMYDPVFMMDFVPDGLDASSTILLSYVHLNRLLDRDLRLFGNISAFRAWRRANMLHRLSLVKMKYREICGALISCYVNSIWHHAAPTSKSPSTPTEHALDAELRLHVEAIHFQPNLFTMLVGLVQSGSKEELHRLVSLDPHARTWNDAANQLDDLVATGGEQLKDLEYVRMPTYDIQPYPLIMRTMLLRYKDGNMVLRDLLAKERSKSPLLPKLPETIAEKRSEAHTHSGEKEMITDREIVHDLLFDPEKSRDDNDRNV